MRRMAVLIVMSASAVTWALLAQLTAPAGCGGQQGRSGVAPMEGQEK